MRSRNMILLITINKARKRNLINGRDFRFKYLTPNSKILATPLKPDNNPCAQCGRAIAKTYPKYIAAVEFQLVGTCSYLCKDGYVGVVLFYSYLIM